MDIQIFDILTSPYKIQFELYCTNIFERSVLTKFQDATLQTERDKSCNAAFNNAFQLG